MCRLLWPPRTIESRNSRMITMLVNPLMSCSARLPVYVLLAGAFFPPNNASFILLSLYVCGILLAVVMARLFKRFLFKEEDVPFVMELPLSNAYCKIDYDPYVGKKAKQYLHKMGGVILVASLLSGSWDTSPATVRWEMHSTSKLQKWKMPNWIPRKKTETIAELERLKNMEHQKNSYIGTIGQTIQPVLHPLGFDWKMSVSLLTGMAAKKS